MSASQGAVCFGGGSASGGMSASLLPGGGVSVGGGRGVYHALRQTPPPR